MAESRYQNRVEILQGTLDQLILQPLFAVSSTVTASPKLSAPARANCFQLRPSARKERLARFKLVAMTRIHRLWGELPVTW